MVAMRLGNLRQAPFNCTMMGALRGALDYYGTAASDAWLYGAGGHAFVLNIHRELCPSGPYCWDVQRIEPLIANVGLRRESLGFFHGGSSAAERAAVESRLIGALADGLPCMLVNMENQLITGRDETGFLTAQPWECNDFPPSHLTFGTWQELGEGIHIDFHVLHHTEPASPRAALLDALRYAVDIWRNPKAHTSEHYGMGPDGYANWSAAVSAGLGGSHGNWWNGTVWAECRAFAAAWFREVAPLLPAEEDASFLSEGYAALAELLGQCADKELPGERKLALLAEAREREAACVARIEQVLAAMG